MTAATLSLVDSVYAALRQRLQLSEIGLGDRLVDTEVAAEYGTSRMPAREALLRLVAEGFLVGSTRGFIVPDLSREDVADLFELRRQLEPRAAAAAARDLTPEAKAALDGAMAVIREAHEVSDSAAMVRANLDFRNAWTGCLTNRRLAIAISGHMDCFQAIRLQTFDDFATRRGYVAALGRLHEALVARDSLAAGDRMTLFLFTAEAAYLTALDEMQREAAEQTRSAGRHRSGSRKTRQ
ncbi:GntR family transcriptional regulator [Rhizobium halophytocola]|uniref:DNA-binding GntR family transcriptional regulator n=1 Tax=Rhizobium halophytocola TaxID=735519 RepID=A0ABS4DV98_9HYPH|nr:GntR family transcriptional regulator [Rhizobium halophytocola]MBP1849612.1 DNA-binding GntR family transcriptional regulator [Rhizobium halophytocola]